MTETDARAVENARLDDVRREFHRLRQLADDAIGQIDDDAFFATPGEDPDTNSIAIVVKHVAGNMRSRWTDFLTTDGEKPDRQRDTEFVIDERDTRAALDAAWDAGWTVLFSAIDPLGANDLDRTVTIRGESLTVWQAVLRQLSHYAYHVGQIVSLARMNAGQSWRSLSVPRGGSVAFNADPDPYLRR